MSENDYYNEFYELQKAIYFLAEKLDKIIELLEKDQHGGKEG